MNTRPLTTAYTKYIKRTLYIENNFYTPTYLYVLRAFLLLCETFLLRLSNKIVRLSIKILQPRWPSFQTHDKNIQIPSNVSTCRDVW